MNEVEITHENFEDEVIKSNMPVLLDFWAEWCGPCKMIEPIVSEIAQEYSEKIKVGKVNVDKYPEIATKYGIRSIPTLFFFKNGEILNQVIGFLSKKDLKKKVEDVLRS